MDFPTDNGLEAMILTSDLQSHDGDGSLHGARLIAHRICEELQELGEVGSIPHPRATGVILAGDLWAHDPGLKKRGGAGDVQEVWRHFSDAFRWVAGVAGNHDLFEGVAEFPLFFAVTENIHPLHGNLVTLDGIRIGGISGVPGNPAKPWRYEHAFFWSSMERLLALRPHILVLHQGPERELDGAIATDDISTLLAVQESPPPLVVFGHRCWPEPVTRRGATSLVSTDHRVILLTRPGALG